MLKNEKSKNPEVKSFVTHSLLGSLAAQAELGDMTLDDEQLMALRLAPNMSSALMARIKELHR